MLVEISYICTREGSLYFAAIIDLHRRRVIGWTVCNHMKLDLAIRALNKAAALHQPTKACIHHFDQVNQCCSHENLAQ